MTLVSIVLKNLGRSKRRSILTVAGIAVSLFVCCFLLTMYRGMLSAFASAGTNNNLVVMQKEIPVPPASKLPKYFVRRIRSLPNVSRVNTELTTMALYKTDIDQVIVAGIDAEVYRPVTGAYPGAELEIADNRSQTDDYREVVGIHVDDGAYIDFKAHRDGVLVGRKLAAHHGWKVGEIVRMKSAGGKHFAFAVKGIFTDGGGLRESTLLAHQEYVRKVIGHGDLISIMFVKVDDRDAKESVVSAIDSQFANNAFRTRTQTEEAFFDVFGDQVGQMRNFLFAMFAMAIFSTLMGAANSIALSTRERVNEIGVLKALGFRQRTILAMILGESTLISLAGGLIACLLGFFVLGLGRLILPMGPMVMVLTLQASTIGYLLVIALVIGCIGGIVPAYGAARLNVIEALARVV